MGSLEEKIKEAEQTLRLAAEMSEYYYHKPLIICYSGGKDSDVLLDIAKHCLKPNEFEVLNAHTTVDAPETVYHIRSVFKALNELGIKTTIKMPTHKGQPTSMWKLIELHTMPPTRMVRYCCAELKEASTPKRIAAVGVREDESAKRKNRGDFGVLNRNVKKREYRSTQHTYAMFKMDKMGGDNYECEMIKACKAKKDTICNPIYHFTNRDIWSYVETHKVEMNPLYAKGYRRVGCIGCPLGGPKEMYKEFADYPKYKENYIKAFNRMIKNRKAKGQSCDTFTSGEAVMAWWLNENPNQVTFEELLGGQDND